MDVHESFFDREITPDAPPSFPDGFFDGPPDPNFIPGDRIVAIQKAIREVTISDVLAESRIWQALKGTAMKFRNLVASA